MLISAVAEAFLSGKVIEIFGWGKYVLECYIISEAMTTLHQLNFLLPRKSIS
jgi:hypothetical protein